MKELERPSEQGVILEHVVAVISGAEAALGRLKKGSRLCLIQWSLVVVLVIKRITNWKDGGSEVPLYETASGELAYGKLANSKSAVGKSSASIETW